MNKRGQFFIFVAIIVALVIFVLVSKSNTMREEISLENFKALSQNYLTESPKVINYAIYSLPADQQIQQLSDFSEDFINNYARNNDPNIGLIYIYNDPNPENNKVAIQNLLKNEQVNVVTSSANQLLFSTSDSSTGDLCISDTGVCTQATANLCDINLNYCVLSGNSLSGPLTLKIGDISYNFELPANNPGFIVIVKSTEGETTKVDISQKII